MREQSESNHTHYIVYKDCRYNYNKTTTNNLYRKERITPIVHTQKSKVITSCNIR
ncbi:hypothetical protein MARVELLAND_79 [Bacillus phage vB_BspM_MarvelLand]|nr:hypothetical protein MARVELLAND_79 [Bacillus phage vB_BspM_MarvelLand]